MFLLTVKCLIGKFQEMTDTLLVISTKYWTEFQAEVEVLFAQNDHTHVQYFYKTVNGGKWL